MEIFTIEVNEKMFHFSRFHSIEKSYMIATLTTFFCKVCIEMIKILFLINIRVHFDI